MMTRAFLSTLFSLSVPVSALAATNPTPQTINDIFIGFTIGNMKGLIPAIILVGLVTFLAGVLKFMKAGDNEEARQGGRDVMIYGIVILFVMISFWGFVGYLTQSFFGKKPALPDYLPTLMQAK